MKTLKYKCIKDFHTTDSTEENPDVPFVAGNTYTAKTTGYANELLFTNESGVAHYMQPNATLENDNYIFSDHLVLTEG